MRLKVVVVTIAFSLAVGSASAGGNAAAANTAMPADIQKLAASMAHELTTFCPPAAKDDVPAHEKCTAGLRTASFIPWNRDGILFGGEQKDLRLSKWPLTHFKPSIFQLMYMSLFTFAGKWSVDEDPRQHVNVIHIEAYFRNAMPPGEFPYPFWHSAAKWNAYETANELNFFLTKENRVFVVTRSPNGSEAARGPYAHVTPPAFDGHWQWNDASGHLEPRASLFSNKYSAGNPFLPALDNAYKRFAIAARNGSCLECHTPENKATMDHLVLLQTPVHASGEIDRVLKEVKNHEMPQDDLGLRKHIDPKVRNSIVQTGEVFREEIAKADRWETLQENRASATSH